MWLRLWNSRSNGIKLSYELWCELGAPDAVDVKRVGKELEIKAGTKWKVRDKVTNKEAFKEISVTPGFVAFPGPKNYNSTLVDYILQDRTITTNVSAITFDKYKPVAVKMRTKKRPAQMSDRRFLMWLALNTDNPDFYVQLLGIALKMPPSGVSYSVQPRSKLLKQFQAESAVGPLVEQLNALAKQFEFEIVDNQVEVKLK